MSSALSSPFMAESIAEVVPDVVKVAGKLAMSSVITGRRRVRLVPQSGQSYSSGASSGIVNILIQDGQAYADLLSACVTFNLSTASTAGAGSICVPDDGAYSVFRRALVSVNSTLMDDIDFLPKKVNTELYATVSQDWYNSVGSMLGLWKNNTTVYGYAPNANPATASGLIEKYAVPARILEWVKRVQSNYAGATATYSSNQFSIPVSLLTSFFRNDTLFPSRNAGQLYLQLNLASAVESLFGAGSYTISNLTLELDYVDLHPTYLSLMDDLIESPGGSGVNWAFDAHLVTSQSIGSGAGQKSVVVSKASQNMRSLQCIVQPTASLASGAYFPQSTFNNPGLIDIQYRIGSLYYPAFTAVGEARAFMDLQNAFGSPESVDKCGLVDSLNYYLCTLPTATVAPVADTVLINKTGTLSVIGTAGNNATQPLLRDAWSDMWMYAYCFDRLKHAKFHGVELDGINTLTSSGSQMVVQINCAPVVDSTLTSIVRFTRVLHLGGGATSVIG